MPDQPMTAILSMLGHRLRTPKGGLNGTARPPGQRSRFVDVARHAYHAAGQYNGDCPLPAQRPAQPPKQRPRSAVVLDVCPRLVKLGFGQPPRTCLTPSSTGSPPATRLIAPIRTAVAASSRGRPRTSRGWTRLVGHEDLISLTAQSGR